MCLLQIAQIINAIATPIIATSVGIIAYQQWKTNKQKLKFDLYDRRLKLYEKSMEFIGKMMIKGNQNDVHVFNRDVSESIFLFETDEIPNYLKEFGEHGQKLTGNIFMMNTEKENNPDGPRTNKYQEWSENYIAEVKWFEEQQRILPKKFKIEINIFK
jgi:hypothetical protein